MIARLAPRPYRVLPVNWPAVQLFVRVNTQWARAPLGDLLDLDYTAVDVILRRLRIDPEPADFRRLMTLGQHAARAVNQRD